MSDEMRKRLSYDESIRSNRNKCRYCQPTLSAEEAGRTSARLPFSTASGVEPHTRPAKGSMRWLCIWMTVAVLGAIALPACASLGQKKEEDVGKATAPEGMVLIPAGSFMTLRANIG